MTAITALRKIYILALHSNDLEFDSAYNAYRLHDIKSQIGVILFFFKKLTTNIVTIDEPDRDIFLDQKASGVIKREFHDKPVVYFNIMPVEGDKSDSVHGKVSDRTIDFPDMHALAPIRNPSPIVFLRRNAVKAAKICIFPLLLTKLKFDTENRFALTLDMEQLLMVNNIGNGYQLRIVTAGAAYHDLLTGCNKKLTVWHSENILYNQ